MKEKESIEILLTFISLLILITVISVVICTLKYRELADNYAELATKCKRLEYRQVTVINYTPETHINVEPSDDEIVITVGQDIFKKGGD